MLNDENTPDLEQDENESQEGQENQNDNQDQNQNKQESNDDGKDWKAEALKYKAILDRNKNKPNKEQPSKKASTDDYGFKAYLALNGVKNANEVDLVKQYMSETGKTAEQVIASKFFQAELKEMQDIAKTENASPDGRKAANNSLDSVEYWMTKPIEEVPKEMRIKVINKRLEQDNSKGTFYNS